MRVDRSLGRRSALFFLALGAAAAAAPSLLGGCEEDKAKGASDRSAVLATSVDAVALPLLDEMRAAAEALPAALDAFASQPSDASLQGARDAWSAARGAYRRTLAFGLGPSDDIAITGDVLDEPADPTAIETLVASDPPPDLTRVRSSPASVRGSLALEYLLFGPDPSAVVASFSTADRASARAALLEALGADLSEKLTAVVQGWTGGFADQLKTAGKGSTLYKAQRDAFDALLNQTLKITDRTLDIVRKSVGITLENQDAPVADLSDRTLTDLTDDLAGVEALYVGRWKDKSGPSISSVVAEGNAGADQAMRDALTQAKAALDAFPRPLHAQSGQPVVDDLIARLRAARTALAVGVFNALGVSVGISDKDGD